MHNYGLMFIEVMALTIIVCKVFKYLLAFILYLIFPPKDDDKETYIDSKGMLRRRCNNHPVEYTLMRNNDGTIFAFWTDKVNGDIILDEKGMKKAEKERDDRVQTEIEEAKKYGFKVYSDPLALRDLKHFPVQSHYTPLKEISTGRYCYPYYDEIAGEFILQYLEKPNKLGICWQYQKADKKILSIEEFEHYNPLWWEPFGGSHTILKDCFVYDGGSATYPILKFDKKKLDEKIYRKAKEVANGPKRESMKCKFLVKYGYIKSLDDYDEWINSFRD